MTHEMHLYRECRGGGDVSLDREIDGKWVVLDMVEDAVIERRYRFWVFAFIAWALA